ncbi:hypothetical protein SDC9_180611 [bioreactor metagenome]|uniref:Pyridoxamine 5'-phosphate oxidase putative domain-containing protein n=1 Tax=bioreactor metagenome TaxID=1076179 RepID=A0A645H291_9ZZZZ
MGFADGKSAYIVPLNFGYTQEDGKWSFYFHGAAVGRKLDLIRTVGYAGFELDTNHKVNEDKEACEYSFRFQSVIGQGPVRLIEGLDEKKAALQLIMAHYSGKSDWTFPDSMVAATAIFRLEAEELCCKEHG